MADKDNILCDADKRLFYLSDDIDNVSIGSICFNILFILHEDDENDKKEKNFKRKPIKIYINSFGGSTYDMWALIDIILHSKTPIHTYCTGYAMSAGFEIFLAGHKRFIGKYATLLYHQLSAVRFGTYQDLVESREELDYLQNSIEEYVLERTKITKEKLLEVRVKKIDWFIHHVEAIELGIADKTI